MKVVDVAQELEQDPEPQLLCRATMTPWETLLEQAAEELRRPLLRPVAAKASISCPRCGCIATPLNLKEFATKYMWWFFLIQKTPLPEHMVGADAAFFSGTTCEDYRASAECPGQALGCARVVETGCACTRPRASAEQRPLLGGRAARRSTAGITAILYELKRKL
jgi:hypothetical protein